MRKPPRYVWVLAFLGLTIGLGASVWWYSYTTGMDRLAEKGRADLTLAADRLSSKLLRYRELAVVLTSHPDLQALFFGGGDKDESEFLVRAMADKTGARSVEVVGAHGDVLASSSEVPQWLNPSRQPLGRALTGAIGTTHLIVPRAYDAKARVFIFAAPVFSPEGPSVGAVVTSVDVSGIEENWPGNAPAAFFVGANELIFVSNRSELLLTQRGVPGSFPDHSVSQVSGNEVWKVDGGPYLPRLAVHLERSLPAIGLTANVLLDAGPVAKNALLSAAATIALMLVSGAALLGGVQKRRVLDIRLAVEAAANARLETRVAERTRALAAANADLRHEITERKEAEAALEQAQDDLVQAGKLSALGKMSAGISHELNQPLMALQSFAENGLLFFDRGKPEAARENLSKITGLAHRMGRIIQNLRAFARHESGPVSDVDIVRVIDDALEMIAEKITCHDVAIDWIRPSGPILVRGGEVRLQQVVVNLASNAVDAMRDMDADAPRKIGISLDCQVPHILLSVRDTGPGLRDPGRVFDPFYTTKAVGAAEGIGLGLSISYGLVQSFGGTIRGANHPEGGAVFTVELIRANAAETA